MTALIRFFVVMLATIILTGCGIRPTAQGASTGGTSERMSGTLHVSGSSTIAPLASEIARRFEARYPEVRVDVQTGGSSRGIADVVTDLADIGMSSRALKPSEAADRQTWTVAMDGVAFIIHVSNPVTSLTVEQLRSIYTGDITNWSAVGGEDAEITVINRAAGRSELELVTHFFSIVPAEIAADVIAGENQQGLKMVAGDPHAITYLSVGASEYEAALGVPIKLLPLQGIAATTRTVADGTYPLSRPLILVTSLDPSPIALAFIELARSLDVHDLVEDLSYVPLTN